MEIVVNGNRSVIKAGEVMELSVNNTSYLSEPTAVIAGDERRRREREMKRKKGRAQEKDSSTGGQEDKRDRLRLVDLSV